MKNYIFFKIGAPSELVELPKNEVKDKYKKFLKLEGYDWAKYYGHRTVFFFVGDTVNGLGLRVLPDVMKELESDLMPLRYEFYLKHQNQES